MSRLNFQHFILTRFSYRPPSLDPQARAKAGADWFLRHDPLDKDVLEFRLALFELTCLPCIQAQSSQKFDWIIIVDPDLPAGYRQRLEAALAKRPRTHLHEINADDHLDGLEWLRQYISPDIESVLTTLLDDDDVLPSDFVEILQARVNEVRLAVPALMTFGVKKSLQWDIYASRKQPCGMLAPWHRPQWCRSVGFSVLCKTRKYPLTCFALNHMAGDI